MAFKRCHQTLIMAFFIYSLFAVATAQPSSSCTSALVSLSPCLNFITGNDTTPTSSCCAQLGSVVKSEPLCLCAVLSGSAAAGLGISINTTQALALPAACKVQTPPVSQCATSSSPPSNVSPSTPNGGPSGNGSKNVPSVDTGSANGSAAKTSSTLVLSLIFVAVFSSILTMSD